jgi:iron complex transport system substrate-binding protein
VRRLVVTSTTHLGLVELLDARDVLVGIGQADYVYDADIRRRVEQGQIQQVAVGGSLNVELVLALQPDLVMVSANPSGTASYQPLLAAGIPVIVNAEWQEASPLGKAEWVKLLALLLSKELVANEQFEAIATAYDSLVQQVPQDTEAPLVITGSPFQGAWYVPGHNSHVGQLLRDARATWPGEHDSSAVSFNVALETLYPYGLRADYWINPGMYRQRSDLRATDDRLAAFRPYRRGAVYAHTRRVSAAGGNDYYESGAVRPDRVLADLIEIFHPEVLNHSFYYYQKLE